MDAKELKAISKDLSESDVKLLRRFMVLKSSCTTLAGNKYLLHPDKKDLRWGIEHFGGCEPITTARAEKLIAKMEQEQKVEEQCPIAQMSDEELQIERPK